MKKKLSVVCIITLLIGMSFISLTNAVDINNNELITTNENIKDNFVQGEIIVKFKPNTYINLEKNEDNIVITSLASIDKLNKECNVHDISKVFTTQSENELSCFYKFTLPNDTDIFSIIDKYEKNPNVECVVPNIIMSAYIQPNDPYYYPTENWEQGLWGLHKIKAEDAWNYTTGNDNIIVAVIDTGVDYNHPDIINNMWINEDEIPENNIDDDNDGFIDNIYGADIYYNDSDPMDANGHGTHCAGTIAAVGNNSLGVTGVSWHTRIMAVKALSDGASAGVDKLASSIIWAADNGANILSNSWGSDIRWPSEPIIEAACRYAYDKGCLIVFAAGNVEDDAQYYSPQNMDKTFVVAATTPLDEKASFSNWGLTVDVSAPGVDILSLRANNTDFYYDDEHIIDEDYYYASGTSMACPHVAGLAALLLSKNNTLDQDTVRTMIEYSTDKITSSKYIGTGRINALCALQKSPISIRLDSFADNTDVKGIVDITGTAWGEHFEYFIMSCGKGQHPSSWTVLTNSSTSIKNNTLYTLNTTSLDEACYTFKLQLVCSDGTYGKRIHAIINNEFNTIIVNNTSIQDAINNAGHDDSVYVMNGTYNETITIKTSISLIGENKQTTIIDGAGRSSVVNLYCNEITITGFTIKNEDVGSGINIDYDLIGANYNNIYGNIIRNNNDGIFFRERHGCIYSCTNISGNKIINNSNAGIHTIRSTYSTITNNTIDNNTNYGIFLSKLSSNNTISRNTITNNSKGISFGQYFFDGSNNGNTFFKNKISQNTYGICFQYTFSPSENNLFYANILYNNINNAHGKYNNIWYNESAQTGNYWDDFDSNYGFPCVYWVTGGGIDTYPNMGDLDFNTTVDSTDFNLFLLAFGSSLGDPNYNPFCDYDNDDTISFVDYQKWLMYYNNYNQ